MNVIKSLFILFLLAACASKTIVEPGNVTTLKVHNYKDKVLVAGFPSKNSLKTLLTNQNISAVVDIRSTKELADSPYNPEEVSLQGRTPFYNYPYLIENNISQSAVDKIAQVIKNYSDGKVLVYCSSGNRASSFLAAYLVQYESMKPEEAIVIAKDAGLSSQPLLEKTTVHLMNK